MATFYSECTRALTFENLCTALQMDLESVLNANSMMQEQNEQLMRTAEEQREQADILKSSLWRSLMR